MQDVKVGMTYCTELNKLMIFSMCTIMCSSQSIAVVSGL